MCTPTIIFQPFSLSYNLQVKLLQFVDDILIVGQPSWKNIWRLKAMLPGFEFCSCLSINFIKSRVIGFNVKQNFLFVVSNYLLCAVSPFNFLGILIGCNPRKGSSWSLVLAKVRIRLASWKGNFLSLGGRVTLLNSVLNMIPLFSFFFYKALKMVIQEFIEIQRGFLWKGKENIRRINWVAWSTIFCRRRVEGLA